MPADATDHADRGLHVSVVFSAAAGEVDQTDMRIAPGATVANALTKSDLQARHPAYEITALAVRIWGIACARDTLLRDRDRVEVYRPLRVDPMAARRRRQQVQQAAAAERRKAP